MNKLTSVFLVLTSMLFFNWTPLSKNDSATIPNQPVKNQHSSNLNTNLCPEGQYYDLNRNGCFPLCLPNLGFDWTQFNNNAGTQVFNLQTCTQAALQNLLNSIGPNGGIVNLPACTITLSSKLFVPENVTFQGAGIGQTIITVNSGFTGHILETKFISNAIIRDLTLDGKNELTQAIVAWYTDNLLIERIEVKNSGRNGIDLRYIQNVTVRYSQVHGTGLYHGISSKDCSSNSDLTTCQNQAGNTAPGVLWTTSYALYSNELYNCGSHGINMHAINGEVAGNYSHDNEYGSKFFDAEDVLIHHNKFENSSSWGTHITSTLNIPSRQPRNITFFKNQFIGAQSDYPVRIAVADSEIYLIDNTYSGNANQEIRNSVASGIVQGCIGTQDMSIAVAGTALTTAPSAICANTSCETSPTTNLCPEGQYYDLNRNGCFPLCNPQLGFDLARFNNNTSTQEYNLQNCTETDLQNLLNSIGTNGGTVNLPACTITLSSKLFVPENVTFQGAGIGQTIITVNSGFTGHVLETKFISNAIIRDLTIDGKNELTQAIVAWYTDNLLIERIEVKNSGRNGIDLRYIQNVSVRYCQVFGTGLYHGISSKDCSSNFDLAACQSQAGNTAPGVLWTTSYALYSNEVYNNTSNGMNLHALNGEVAGNYSHDNGFGSKFINAEDVLIHHNHFENNASWGTQVSSSLNIPDRLPRNLTFYQNQFTGSQADYPVRIGIADEEIYLVDNTYTNNANQEIRNMATSGVVEGCAGTQDMSLPAVGTALTTAPSTVCTFSCQPQTRLVQCNISLYLEGPFDPGAVQMSSLLYKNDLLPPGQPYNTAPWNYNGSEGAGWTMADYPVGAVDWVLVSLRDGPLASDLVTRFAGVLLEDGRVQFLGDVSLSTALSEVYVLVEHRNHLPAMSPNPVSIVGTNLTYDFTPNNGYTATGFGQKPINNIWVLYAGNADQSNPIGYEITGADRILWQTANGLFDVYEVTDFNLDRDVTGFDRLIWNENNGISSGVPK